jgi:hypothetical protein
MDSTITALPQPERRRRRRTDPLSLDLPQNTTFLAAILASILTYCTGEELEWRMDMK